MAAITNSSNKPTEFSGEYKLWSFYNLAIASASDTLTLTFAANSVASIQNVIVCINAGQDAAFTAVAVSFDSLVITVTSVEQDGTASTAWTDTTINMIVIGK